VCTERPTQLTLAGLVLLGLVQGTYSLEIYRIGGESLPHPDQPGITFHKLSWQDLTEQSGLDQDALAAGTLRPLFLQPTDNIAATSPSRGGGAYAYVQGLYGDPEITPASQTLIDQDPSTSYDWEVSSAEEAYTATKYVQRHRLTLALGEQFFLNRVRLVTKGGHYPDRLTLIATLDESLGVDLNLGPVGQVLARVPDNQQDTLDLRFPPTPARTLDLDLARITPKQVQLSEIEVYGQGYIRHAAYVSPFIDLGQPAIWGPLRWQGRQDPGAEVWIRTRSGEDLDPNRYWRYIQQGQDISPLDEESKPLDATSYARLPPGEAAPITYDTQHWSFWTAPYAFEDSTGTQVLSPGLRPVFQVRVDFYSDLQAGGELSYVEWSATRPPLAAEVVGEISPAQVEVGQTVRFTYALRPTMRAQHSGFDQVEIASPFGVVGVDTVKVSGVPVPALVTIEKPDSTLFSVRLPRHLDTGDSGEWIEVVFRAPVLRYNTRFDGWVRDTQRPLEVAQPIAPGNAIEDLHSETLTVLTSFTRQLLGEVQVSPQVATPNGDGVNEQITFSFDLLRLTDPAPLRLEIYDLVVRRCRVVYAGEQASGRLRLVWDCRGEGGERVLPGLYLYRLEVRAAQDQEQRVGTVRVVY
jgi:hypothetical protein